MIFSGGSKKDNDQAIYDEIKEIHKGGGFGSIIGRNSFQREKGAALEMLGKVMDIYKS